ncbi:hypothetical protein GGR51DRAFT_75207 [Nemania sp. FL0031]|nr:hypothetical protein GGR51DRAFT_75207 [Nemania sp. FL0031]
MRSHSTSTAISPNLISVHAFIKKVPPYTNYDDSQQLLESLRGAFTNNNNPSHHRNPGIPIPELSALISQYQRATQSAPPPLLSVSGRYLPFLYHLISTLISAPHSYTVVIVDTEGKFDATRLVASQSSSQANYPATLADLAHVHLYRPGRSQEGVKAVLGGVDEFMLYGDHASRGRQWWGTVVIGGAGGGGLVHAGWKGWLRVEREDVGVGGFAAGVSIEEALQARSSRMHTVEQAGWTASSRWGSYSWKGP